jgi:hypothetical protein
MLKQTTHNEDVWEIGDLAPHILSPGTRWRGEVSFISRSLYSRGLSSRYPLVQSLGGPQIRNVRRKLTHFFLNSVQLISVYSGDCEGISLWHGHRYRYTLVSYRLDLRSYSSAKTKAVVSRRTRRKVRFVDTKWGNGTSRNYTVFLNVTPCVVDIYWRFGEGTACVLKEVYYSTLKMWESQDINGFVIRVRAVDHISRMICRW